MNYVRYNRSFIMMEEQGEKFASKASAPIKGHLKVETGNNKGAMRCGVQNLKYYEKGDYIYKLILFGKKGEKAIHSILGTLLVNRQGNGETYLRFQPLNVDGKGNAYHDYSTVIIAAASTIDEKEPLHPVLKGSISGENQPFQWSLFQTEEREPLEKEQEEGILEEARGPVSKKVYNNFYNEYVLHVCAHTCRVAEFYEDVEPFARDKTGAQWKKIGNVMNLPLVSPGAHYFASQYQHYLFGAKADKDGMAVKYYFGIPGRFLTEEQPDGGRSGFSFWQPIRGAEEKELADGTEKRINKSAAYGYWILAVDGKTGDLEEV